MTIVPTFLSATKSSRSDQLLMERFNKCFLIYVNNSFLEYNIHLEENKCTLKDGHVFINSSSLQKLFNLFEQVNLFKALSRQKLYHHEDM